MFAKYIDERVMLDETQLHRGAFSPASPERWPAPIKTLERTWSPVSVLDSPTDGLQPHSAEEPALPTSLRSPHRLPTAQELVALMADAAGRQQLRRAPLALQVTAGAWTQERRAAYEAACRGRPLLLPEEVPALRASLQHEVDAISTLLRTRRIEALHFCTPGSGVISGRRTSELMHRVLSSWVFQEQQARCLQELAVHDWLATREACHALPPLAGSLRRLLLSGCHSRLDMGPLSQLMQLEELVIQTDVAPALESLPPGLQRLELDIAGVGARVRLPRHLHLDSLIIRCQHGRVLLSAPLALRQCKEVHVECGTVIFLGLLGAEQEAGKDGISNCMRHGAEALVATFSRLPSQLLRVQANRLAFARRPPSSTKQRWPHELRYVQSSSFGSLLAAAQPLWQQVEAVPLQYCPADAPLVQQAAPHGAQLCKRSGLLGAYHMPPLARLCPADLHFLAAMAMPTELRFHSGCEAQQQHRLLSNSDFQTRDAPHLRRLLNLHLQQHTDLSCFGELEMLQGTWSAAGGAPAHPLPPSLRELHLTATHPDASLDGDGMLAGFSGSLTARGFSAMRLPPDSHPLQLDITLTSGTALSDISLHLKGRAERLFLRLHTSSVTARTTQVVFGTWLGQADLLVVDLRQCSSVVQLLFPGGSLEDLFSGSLRAAAAAGLRRLELLVGDGMERFDCPRLQLMAQNGSCSHSFSVAHLRRLLPEHLGGWRLLIAATPWRLCFVCEA